MARAPCTSGPRPTTRCGSGRIRCKLGYAVDTKPVAGLGGIAMTRRFELGPILVAAALSALAPDTVPADRRWLPWIVAAAVIVVAVSIINPPPAAAGRDVDTGAWVAFGASLGMVVGAVLSLSRVSFSVAVEGRETRQRVAAVDERQPTTETAAVMETRRGRDR